MTNASDLKKNWKLSYYPTLICCDGVERFPSVLMYGAVQELKLRSHTSCSKPFQVCSIRIDEPDYWMTTHFHVFTQSETTARSNKCSNMHICTCNRQWTMQSECGIQTYTHTRTEDLWFPFMKSSATVVCRTPVVTSRQWARLLTYVSTYFRASRVELYELGLTWPWNPICLEYIFDDSVLRIVWTCVSFFFFLHFMDKSSSQVHSIYPTISPLYVHAQI